MSRFKLCCFLIFFLTFIAFFLFCKNSYAFDNNILRSQLKNLPTDTIEIFWDKIKQEYGKYFLEENASLFDLILEKKNNFSIKNILNGLLKFFFHEILYNSKLLVSIVILTVFSIILKTLQTAFESKQVSNVAYAIVFIVILTLAMNSFNTAIYTAKAAISKMIDFMLALVPLLLTLLSAMGNITLTSFFHPFLVSVLNVISMLIYTIYFPLLFFSVVLNLVSGISEKYKLNRLADLLKKLSIGFLGLLLAVFLGVISLQGTTLAVTDGITLRTAKYFAGNFIPVVGKTISEAADTVMGASLLVKNIIGLSGVVILLLICIFPALKIFALSFIYNFCSAILQPLGTGPVIDSLAVIGKTLIYIFAALVMVGLMLFLTITIILLSGNISLMLR